MNISYDNYPYQSLPLLYIWNIRENEKTKLSRDLYNKIDPLTSQYPVYVKRLSIMDKIIKDTAGRNIYQEVAPYTDIDIEDLIYLITLNKIEDIEKLIDMGIPLEDIIA